MSTIKPLLDFYKGILSFSSMQVNDLGYIECVLMDNSTMCTIDGKSLIFPIDERLRRYDLEKELIFHPMTESIVRGESEIQEKLRESFLSKANISIYFLFLKLLEIAKDPARHVTLDPDQAEMLAIVKNVDQKCYDNFMSLGLNVLKGRMVDYRFVDMRLKRSGRYKDKQVDKLGVVFFPFYEKMQQKDVAKLRVRDVEVIKSLYNYVFNMKDEDAYNRPCHGTATPPYLTSYLYAGAALATPINDAYDRFKSTFTGEEQSMIASYTFDLEWYDQLTNIEALLPLVPRISGGQSNLGRIEEKVPAVSKAQPATIPPVVNQQPQQPVELIPGVKMPPPVSVPQLNTGFNPLSVAAGVTTPAIPPTLNQQGQTRQSALSASLRASGIAPTSSVVGNPLLQHQMTHVQEVRRTPSWAAPNVSLDVRVRDNTFGGVNLGNTSIPLMGNNQQQQPSNPFMNMGGSNGNGNPFSLSGMNNPARNDIPPWQV